MVLPIRSPFATHGKLFSFFFSLLLLIILYPLLDSHPIILNVLVAAVFISIVYELAYDQRHLHIALLFAVPGILVNVIDVFAEHPLLTDLNLVLALLFYGYVAVTVLRYVVTSDDVTQDLIFGAVSVYLLIGLIFGIIFLFIAQLNPYAFTVANNELFTPSTAFYYSFSTLTTTGYGDVVPHAVAARTAAILEMIIGPLFVAVTIARLVSNYMPRLSQKRP